MRAMRGCRGNWAMLRSSFFFHRQVTRYTLTAVRYEELRETSKSPLLSRDAGWEGGIEFKRHTCHSLLAPTCATVRSFVGRVRVMMRNDHTKKKKKSFFNQFSLSPVLPSPRRHPSATRPSVVIKIKATQTAAQLPFLIKVYYY